MESFGEGARYHSGGAGQYAALVVAIDLDVGLCTGGGLLVVQGSSPRSRMA